MGVRSRMLEWPVYRQLTGKDPRGRGAAARSRHSEQLTARTATADRAVQSVPPRLVAGHRGRAGITAHTGTEARS
ncbi:hypothetical protein [Streptomyces sp. S07_1.15]|uniref:hypothetical protein n=1 Tax=Streptomyces sp. S07_1.15 TaxID=2873925 RepID=UPI0027E0B918|nr:hypothetical protein [Streptomyces sp. S07_1.15]